MHLQCLSVAAELPCAPKSGAESSFRWPRGSRAWRQVITLVLGSYTAQFARFAALFGTKLPPSQQPLSRSRTAASALSVVHM